jgi:hypothetical protein
VQAWLESERIEKMLNMHTCNIERAFSRFSPFLSVRSNADGLITPQCISGDKFYSSTHVEALQLRG